MTGAFPRASRVAAFFAAFVVAWPMLLRAEAVVPPSPSPSYVYDGAGWLGAGLRQRINGRLEDYERKTSSQVLVAVFPSLPEGAEMADFCQRVFESWKPGQVGKDNGAVLFVFAADRKVRIHTGYGLEGALPDAMCNRIIREVMVPLLRDGDRAGAVEAGVDAILAAARGEYRGSGRTRLDGQRGIPPWGLLVLFLIFVGIVVLAERHGVDVVITHDGTRRGNWSGGWGGGGGFSGGGWGGGGGFSGGGGRSGGGGAGGSW